MDGSSDSDDDEEQNENADRNEDDNGDEGETEEPPRNHVDDVSFHFVADQHSFNGEDYRARVSV